MGRNDVVQVIDKVLDMKSIVVSLEMIKGLNLERFLISMNIWSQFQFIADSIGTGFLMQLPVTFYGKEQMAPHDAVCNTLTDCPVDGPA